MAWGKEDESGVCVLTIRLVGRKVAWGKEDESGVCVCSPEVLQTLVIESLMIHLSLFEHAL